MVIFSRELKRLRERHIELRDEVRRLSSKEKRLSDRLRRLEQRRAELYADKDELTDGD